LVFSPRQTELLRTLVNRIIPADQDPSGWDAGVGAYLFRQLDGGNLKPLLPVYQLGLVCLEAEALAAHETSFDRLPDAAQDELLARIAAGRVATPWMVDPAAFFHMAAEHCAEGYYGDPGNGGNTDGTSWKMIGFEVRG
jgi:hypothetical protein